MAIEKEIELLLAEPSFSPLDIGTFNQAIRAGALEAAERQIIAALNSDEPDFCELGRAIYNAVYDYCYQDAKEHVLRIHRYLAQKNAAISGN